MECNEALCHCLLALHLRNLCGGTSSRRLAGLDSSPSRSKALLWLPGFLLDAAGRLELSGHEPSPRCHGESRARFADGGTLFGLLHWPNPVLVPLTWVGGIL